MRGLLETYYDIQKVRIALGNQIFSKVNGLSEQAQLHLKDKVLSFLQASEKNLQAFMRASLRHEPIWKEWLKNVKGIGPVLGSALVSYLEPIERFPTISKLWRYSGYACINGKVERREKGQQIHFNPRVKTICWLIGESFVKSKGYYRKLYEEYRKKYDEKWKTPEDCGSPICKKHGKCLDIHRYYAAKRKVIRIFLAHYWMVSRHLKGLPVEKPYICQFSDKHNHVILPEGIAIEFRNLEIEKVS